VTGLKVHISFGAFAFKVRYVVEFDPRENDAKFLERGVFYEDEPELCVPVSKTAWRVG
jgi:hypothetical protein